MMSPKKTIEKNRGNKRFGKLVSEADKVQKGHYIPWARSQKPGSVKEIVFNPQSRKTFVTGFRKRKEQRRETAKKSIVDKEKAAKRKEKREKMRDMLDAYERRSNEMKNMMNGGDNDSDDIDDSESESDREEEVRAENNHYEFGFGGKANAITVEVKEMDLEQLHSESVATSSLPALPMQDNKPISKKKKQEGKGRKRHLKKEKLPKTKRDKRKGKKH
mmetsp:Transcript_44243/g.139577  ORF Transcript_44243/g.139577 Transcript_44243/m.139577 type:complete len:218 (+) Transcript_44243:3-656(+)